MQDTYSYRTFFEQMYRRQGQKYTFCADNIEAALDWKKAFREALRNCLGLPVLEEIYKSWVQSVGQSLVREEEKWTEDGYVRYRFLLETLPNVYMPFYMLVPDQVDGKHPAKGMIALPSHGADKEVVAGVLSNTAARNALCKTPENSYGLEFLRRGYVVFCPDPPGYGGERAEPVPREDLYFGVSPEGREELPGSSCKNLAQTAEALGISFQALMIWDLMRLVDFAVERPEIADGWLGCAGFSGGGQYTMWLAALDDRVQAAVISGYVHGFYDSILDTHLCPCNYAPGLWKLGDISDICSLIAPRPLFVENGIRDPLNGRRSIRGVREQVSRIGEVYRLYHREDALAFVAPEGEHRWYGCCYDFLDQYRPSSL